MIMIQNLPLELQLEIIKKMEIITLFRMREVSKHFKNIIDTSPKSLYLNFQKRFKNHNINLFPKIKFTNKPNQFIFIKLTSACQSYFKEFYMDKITSHQHIYPGNLEQLQKYSIRQLRQCYELQRKSVYQYLAIRGGSLSKSQFNGMMRLKNEGFFDTICYDAVTKTHPAFVEQIIRIKRKCKVSDYFALKAVLVLDYVQINNMIRLKLAEMEDYYSLKSARLLTTKAVDNIIKYKKMGYSDYNAFKELGVCLDNKQDWFVQNNAWDFDFKRYYSMSGGFCME